MRNYFRYFFRDVHGTENDGVGGLFPWDSFGYGASQEAVDASVQFQIDDTTKNLPPGWTLQDVTIDETKTVFFLLDAANFNLLVTGIPNYFHDIGTKNLPYYRGLSQLGDTPRYKGWVDEAGVKRQPPPSEQTATSQASGIIRPSQMTLAQALSTIYIELLISKNQLAPLVFSILQRLIQKKITEQQAIVFMRQLGLLL